MKDGIRHTRWNKKRFITLSIAALVIVAISIGAILVTRYNAVGSTTVMEKRTTKVVKGNIEVVLSGSGTVASANNSDVMSNVQGKITKAYYKEGDKVKAGDLLFEIDDTDARLNIQKIENQISQAQLNVTGNQKSFSNLTITAPFNGKVTDITAKSGESCNNNMTLFTITETSKLKLSVPFSTTSIQNIKVGQRAHINVQEIMDTIEGTVTAIDDYTYTATDGGMVRNVEVVASNPGRLNDSMTASVDINTSAGMESGTQICPMSYMNKQLVKAAANGIFTAVNINENQYVNKGDVLIKLENDDLQITEQSNNLKVQDLQNQLEAAKKQLEDYKIYSPISGTVMGDTAAAGDSVKSGSVLISIRDYEQMQFTISVDELDIAKVKMGQEVSITIDALKETDQKPLSGKVIYKAMEGTSSNGVATYDVKIKINETENLLAGMNANGSIILSQAKDVLMVPLEAITKMGNKAFVRVVGTDASNRMPTDGKSFPRNSSGMDAEAGRLREQSGNGKQPADIGGQDSNATNRTNRNGAEASARRQMSSAFTANQEYYAGTALKEVELGINNDEFAEIKSGLEEGEVVVLPPLVTNSTGSSSQNNQNGFNLGGLGGGMRSFGGSAPGGNIPVPQSDRSSSNRQAGQNQR